MIITNKDHKKKSIINLKKSSKEGIEKILTNKYKDNNSIKLCVYSNQYYISNNLLKDNKNTINEDNIIKVKVIFKEEDKKPIYLYTTFKL